MSTRWFGAQREPKRAYPHLTEHQPAPDSLARSSFSREEASWRSWLSMDLAMLPWWRHAGDGVDRAPWPALDHALQTGIVALMTAAAAVLLVTHQAPVHAGHHRPAHVATAGTVGSSLQPNAPILDAVVTHAARPANAAGHPGSAAAAASKVVSLPSLPVKVTLPSVLPKLRAPGVA